MQTDEFVKLVKDLRTVQKAFYHAESGSADRSRFYHEARTLERKVDKAIPEMEDKQGRLFPEPEPEVRRGCLP